MDAGLRDLIIFFATISVKGSSRILYTERVQRLFVSRFSSFEYGSYPYWKTGERGRIFQI